MYINDLISRLRNSCFGCYVFLEFVGSLFFADDILLLSSSILHLQAMLNICTDYGLEFDIKFNQKKSFLLQFGLDQDIVLPDLFIDRIALSWVVKIKYLGVYLVAGKHFCVDVSTNCIKFLGSACSILQKCGAISEERKRHVINHSCLAMLLYGVDSVHLSSEQVQKLSVAYNNSVRKCFGLARNVSVRNVLYFMRNLPVKQILHMRKVLLIRDCMNNDGVLRVLSMISANSNDFVDLCYMYDVHCALICQLTRLSVI